MKTLFISEVAWKLICSDDVGAKIIGASIICTVSLTHEVNWVGVVCVEWNVSASAFCTIRTQDAISSWPHNWKSREHLLEFSLLLGHGVKEGIYLSPS